MAIMCRIVGIPTRYVEGFTVKVTEGENIVYNKNAHAWVEVYTEELGWVTFDATPGHISISDYLPQSLFIVEEQKETSEEEKEIEQKEDKEKVKEKEESKGTEQKEKKEVKIKLKIPGYVYSILIIILIYLSLYIFVALKVDSITNVVNEIIFYGELNNIKYSRDVTLIEYIGKVEEKTEVDLSRVKDILDSYYYGGRKLSQHDLNVIKRKKRLIANNTKKKGKIKYYFRKTIYHLAKPFCYIFAYIRKNVI
ncbi:transglutaminase-like domain-containing protein [Caloramator sp. mosi_1]|uniref:transglutaminase-like domain-containing protein n=1 Tax=Caloramator sp. mosi_1 TaxID=3023090 RepID=UPI0023616D10|nr:transglutaminase-like domain-containing protein [Caloramator sp. mosi_1]WDC84581.1 transglutaminase-like domain-containing protein [Caloramator sp. mosi_1]